MLFCTSTQKGKKKENKEQKTENRKQKIKNE